MSVKKAGISRKSGAGTFDLDHIVACSAAHFLVTMATRLLREDKVELLEAIYRRRRGDRCGAQRDILLARTFVQR